ncbi:2-dehydropantoate 2-reductase [Asticcacaulis sp.]|uniref:2-dehydropantoate 2-reductase n=1 Tax=Asticcacaulis sp. TaxID=1872648 RepID=UPI002CD4DE58|nr:2-dehydropantoate 2-reductase [Asticcacaulis sp.]HTM81586.1 2-dehydropantoate 2-reductase [Asticcacaulis sp.]
MKVTIIGAGAIGGFLGARLAIAGKCHVSALARGDTLTALQTCGWRLIENDQLIQAEAHATDRPEDLGPQDLIVIAVKGGSLPAVAASIKPLLKPDTIVLPAMNGVPWWFCRDVPGFAGVSLRSVDPDAMLDNLIPFLNVLGCVVHVTAATSEPGLVRHKMGSGLIIGEPDGSVSGRVSQVAGLLGSAGFDVTASDKIRQDIWYKLWGNATLNPVSALTGATVDAVMGDDLVRTFCSAMMEEVKSVGAHIDCPIRQTPEDRYAVTARLGAFKTSMLQDAEAGRPLELDALVGAIREIGQRLGVATPNIDAILGLTRLYARTHGLA